MVDYDTMNHRQLIDELVRCCKERASGTIFLNLLTGQSARLVLNKGVIHWVAYEQLRGRKAIESIREIDQARFSFNPLLKLAIGEQQLPPTPVILKRLYKKNNKPIPVLDQPVVVKTVSPPNPQSDISEEKLFDQDRIRLILEKEALEYLGPIAKVLCSVYMKSMPNQLSFSQIRQLVSTLKQDINDEKKGQLFAMQVKKVIKTL